MTLVNVTVDDTTFEVKVENGFATIPLPLDAVERVVDWRKMEGEANREIYEAIVPMQLLVELVGGGARDRLVERLDGMTGAEFLETLGGAPWPSR